MTQINPKNEKIEGMIERITYCNPDNGFVIAKIKNPSMSSLVTLKGNFHPVYLGEMVSCTGSWTESSQYGKQFQVTQLSKTAPANLVGIEKYLSSGKIQGIGPKFAKRIVETFGLKSLYIIEHEPEKLLKIEGLGTKKLGKLVESLKLHRSYQETLVFLQSYEVTPAYAQKIFNRYGSKSIEIVQNNPYQIARDIKGIGFKLADKMATSLDISETSPQRICAGIEYLLEELAAEGHTCFPQEELLQRTTELLSVDQKNIEDSLQLLIEENRIVVQNIDEVKKVWLKPYYLSEKRIAEEVKRLITTKGFLREVDKEKALIWVSEKLKLKFATAQKEAIASGISKKFLIITGGPGTGKSTITKAILRITEKLTTRIILAAPTGRAAKRMAEITYHKASTIHSLLKFDPKTNQFSYHSKNPLPADLLIVDEASMIDTRLFCALVQAIPSHCRVLLIGDIDQLPSVGAGNVLRDLIDSNLLPVSILTYIFRQGKGSKIAYNAFLINQGYFPKLENESEDDFLFYDLKDPSEILQKIKSLLQELPKSHNFDPLKDIQVLSPMKKGQIGIDIINQNLQKELNSQPPLLINSQKILKKGDKVLQNRNNYQKEVFNGDLGFVQSMDYEEQQLSVLFEGREVFYKLTELDELQLAYCVSIHKYQGSESPCIIMPIHTHHFKLLCRNLLYTGITRGKKLVILLGTKKALAIAIKNNEVLHRHTALKYFVQGFERG